MADIMLHNTWINIGKPTVTIEVVQDGHASLFGTALLHLLPVIRLWSSCTVDNLKINLLALIWCLPSCVGPVMKLRPICWTHLHLVRRPEPTIDELWEKLWLVTTTKIALPS